MKSMIEMIREIEDKKQLLSDGHCVQLLEEAIDLLKLQSNYIAELEANSAEIHRLIKDFKMYA